MVNPISNKNKLKKGLYLVPTPIGNLGDITLRSIEILRSSHCILCEDTRVSKNLFEKFEIKAKIISNHKFNEKKNLLKVINLLKKDQIVSLVSDAGTPTISDPGAILVNECIKNNIDIIPLPGASAITTAISASGFSDRYFFYGFFPEKEKNFKETLKSLSEINNTIVFFISPKKINKIIPNLKKYFANRKILICREISKFYEEYIRCLVNDLNIFEKEPKGELTIVISDKKKIKNNSQILSESDKNVIKKMINKLKTKEIVSILNEISKASKREIYNYCLKLKNEK
jgi:16S rRNA (cytidine1402-2'-O)-methyltransferase